MMFFDVLCCCQGLCLLWSFQLVILPGSSVYISLPHVMAGGWGWEWRWGALKLPLIDPIKPGVSVNQE